MCARDTSFFRSIFFYKFCYFATSKFPNKITQQYQALTSNPSSSNLSLHPCYSLLHLGRKKIHQFSMVSQNLTHPPPALKRLTGGEEGKPPNQHHPIDTQSMPISAPLDSATKKGPLLPYPTLLIPFL